MPESLVHFFTHYILIFFYSPNAHPLHIEIYPRFFRFTEFLFKKWQITLVAILEKCIKISTEIEVLWLLLLECFRNFTPFLYP